MEKGFFNECALDDPGNICFWILLPISIVIWLVDVLF